MKRKTIKKLALTKESLLRLGLSELREVGGGVSKLCTNTAECTESCQLSCACASRLC